MFVQRAFAAITLAVLPFAATAAEIRTARVAGWQAGAYSNDRSGEFSHCSASASYNSGITLYFYINSRFVWTIGFANQSWSLVSGQQIPISYRVDNYAPRSGSVNAVSKTLALMNLPDDVGLFNQFRAGNLLVVDHPGGPTPFRLTGTSVMLATLVECARTRGNLTLPASVPPPPTARPSAPPVVAPAPPVANQEREAAERRLEATQFVANLLSQADMRGHRLITVSEMREMDLPPAMRAADVAWRGENTFGMLSVHANRDPNGLDGMAAEIIASDARACSGEFATARTADPEMQNVRRLSTFCSEGGNAVTLTYLLLPMPGRLVYQMIIFGRGGRSAASAEDQRLRDAVHSIVARHPALGPSPSVPRDTPPAPVGISN